MDTKKTSSDQGETLAFVNGKPAACGCTSRFSSGGGQYSDASYVHLCETHKAKPTRILTAADRKGRVYIAGPMTGLPDLNFPAFNAKAAELRAQGWHVENPAEHGVQDGATWSDYLRHDMLQLATCDTVYLLPGWKNSKGALLEFYNARMLNDFTIIADEGGKLPKTFMYGIQEPDGTAYMEEGCVSPNANDLQPEVDSLNASQEPGEGLYRVVALHTLPAPVTVQVQALMEAEAALELALARITKRDPSHALHITSEYKALELVRNALATSDQEEIAHDTQLVDFLAEKYIGPNFRYGDPSTEVAVIEMPKGSTYCGDFRKDMTAALKLRKQRLRKPAKRPVAA